MTRAPADRQALNLHRVFSLLEPAVWDGVIFLRQGYYNQGIFRFQLEIPQDFPGKDIPVSQAPGLVSSSSQLVCLPVPFSSSFCKLFFVLLSFVSLVCLCQLT